MATGEVPRG
uniref:Uncharacterized protein n=1 Tax=Arundo donax TaxID=35708 RepID=A0A0A8Z7C1_ARUDO